METFLTFLLAAGVTLFFVRRYVKQLSAAHTSAVVPSRGAQSAPAATGTHACPRCGKAIGKGSAFCNHCGAALAMWTVHRSEVKTASAGVPSGKPSPVINASLCIGCGSCVEVCPETGTLELVNGKAILAHADRCTGHAKCAEVCPTQAIVLSRRGVLQTMRVPLVKDNFETNVSGLFIVGELGGMGLIKTAVNEGKLVIDQIKKRMDGSGHAVSKSAGTHGHANQADAGAPRDPAAPADVLIVGAGPAGLSASLSAHQLGLQYITLEQGEIA